MLEDSGKLASEILSDIVVHMKYAKYLPDKHRRETWKEIVDRNKEMHLRKFPQLKEEIEEAYALVYEKKIMPSGRSIQFAGKAIEMSPVRIFNCSALPISDVKAFSEIMFLLLMGSGVGYSVQQHHIRQLPELRGAQKPVGQQRKKRFLVGDSIVGWADAVKALMESYFYGEREIDFDLADIRKKGSILKTSGGKAPGPEPLRICLSAIKSILENAVTTRGVGTKLLSLEAHDIICFIADAILAGGVRRCLPAGTTVFTTSGIKAIEDVQGGDKVYTSDGIHEVLHNFNQGVQSIWTIHTEVGDFSATKNHKMAVLATNGEYIWKRVDELKENDRLLHFSGSVAGTQTKLPENTMLQRPEHSTTCREMVVPELDVDMAWFIGYFHGNGTLYNRQGGKHDSSSHVTVAMNSNNLDIVAKVVAQMDRFGIASQTYKRPNENTITVSVRSQMLVEYFEKHIKTVKTSIVVPEWLQQSTADIRGAYLAGVMDSDGSICSRGIKLCTSVYPAFIQQLKILYSSLGIPTRGYTTERKEAGWQALHTLTLPAFRERYNAFVGIYSVKGMLIQKERHNGFTIPKEIVGGMLKYKDYGKKWCSKFDLNYETSREFESMQNRINEIPIKVRAISQDSASVETYDLEIEGKHEFFANGLLTHNSACSALFSLDDILMLECKFGNWAEANPQRARANNSAVVVRDKITKDVFDNLWSKIQASGSGEPGIYFTNSRDILTNPCFTGDMRLLTSKGYKRFDELVGKSIEVVGKDGKAGAGRVWESGVKEIIRLRLYSGNEITCTPDHMFFTKDERWVEAKDLTGISLYNNPIDREETVQYIRPAGTSKVYDFSEPMTHSGYVEGVLVHNCFEISLGAYGLCNLVTMNASSIENQEDYNYRCRMASRIATLQATYTDFYYLRKEWRELAEKENLIGVSMTGIASKAFLSLDMDEGARNVLQENFEFSEKVGITPSYRTTCTKPEGTMSLVLGTSSGVHAWYAPYYWRRVSIAKDEALYQYLQMAHPSLVEDDFFKPSTMAKIKVPQKAPDDAILRDESALETLERVKKVYMGWVVPGHREGINYNNISTTVNIKPDEWMPVREWMWENRDYYTGIAVLPYDGGTYTQSPFEECTKEEYEEALQHLQKVDLSLVFEEDDSTKLQGELACSGGACEIK